MVRETLELDFLYGLLCDKFVFHYLLFLINCRVSQLHAKSHAPFFIQIYIANYLANELTRFPMSNTNTNFQFVFP